MIMQSCCPELEYFEFQMGIDPLLETWLDKQLNIVVQFCVFLRQ